MLDNSVDCRVIELLDTAAECYELNLAATAADRYGMAARFAHDNQRVCEYIDALFHQMDFARDLFQFELVKLNAVKLIALLESEDAARRIEPAMRLENYEFIASWMTACSYEFLAQATGSIAGYNSLGMKECIEDGMTVCRRSGKLQCIACFREYAIDVHCAANDLSAAEHECHSILNKSGGWSDKGDRRWYAATRLGWIQLVQGQISDAVSELRRAQDFAGKQRTAWLQATVVLNAALLLSGQPPIDLWGQFERAPKGEWPLLEWQIDLNEAVFACLSGESTKAVEILIFWDQLQLEHGVKHYWFETRLRLITANALAGEPSGDLCAELASEARRANDILTLARLQTAVSSPTPMARLICD